MSDNPNTVLMVDATYFRKMVHEELGDGVDPDYARLLDWYAQEHDIVEARYYDAMPHPSDSGAGYKRTQRRAAEFADAEKAGYLSRYGTCVRTGFARYEQHGVDTAMTADLVAFAYKGVGKIILITGNQDVAPGVEVARDKGVKIMLYVDCDYRGQKLTGLATHLVRLSYPVLMGLVKPAPVQEAA